MRKRRRQNDSFDNHFYSASFGRCADLLCRRHLRLGIRSQLRKQLSCNNHAEDGRRHHLYHAYGAAAVYLFRQSHVLRCNAASYALCRHDPRQNSRRSRHCSMRRCGVLRQRFRQRSCHIGCNRLDNGAGNGRPRLQARLCSFTYGGCRRNGRDNPAKHLLCRICKHYGCIGDKNAHGRHISGAFRCTRTYHS